MIRYLLFFPVLLLVSRVSAQSNKDSCCLQKKDLVGVWQIDHKGVGNGVEQNFRFFSDRTFFLDMASNEGEDARGIVYLQGKYRLVKNKLYLTFLARSVVEGGKVVIVDGEHSNILAIKDGTVKLINEINPKECPIPLYISFVDDGGIMLNSEKYYKLTKEDLKMAGIEWRP